MTIDLELASKNQSISENNNKNKPLLINLIFCRILMETSMSNNSKAGPRDVKKKETSSLKSALKLNRLKNVKGKKYLLLKYSAFFKSE